MVFEILCAGVLWLLMFRSAPVTTSPTTGSVWVLQCSWLLVLMQGKAFIAFSTCRLNVASGVHVSNRASLCCTFLHLPFVPPHPLHHLLLLVVYGSIGTTCHGHNTTTSGTHQRSAVSCLAHSRSFPLFTSEEAKTKSAVWQKACVEGGREDWLNSMSLSAWELAALTQCSGFANFIQVYYCPLGNPCPSTFDPQSPLCLTSVSAPCRPRARYASLAPALSGEVNFSTVQLLMLKHKHVKATWTWLLCNHFTTVAAVYE